MSVKLTCEDVRELLSPYIDNMLDDEQMLAVSEHLKLCDACWNEYNELYKITKLLEELPELELPADFDEKLRAAIKTEPCVISFDANHEQSVRAEAVTNLEPAVKLNKKAFGWKKLSSIAAIFVIGIFTLIMYNNSGDLIDDAELENNQESTLNTVTTQEDTSYESSNILSSKKYASAAGIEDTKDEGLTDTDDNSCDTGALGNGTYSNDADSTGNASRSGESENNKVTTPDGVNTLRGIVPSQTEQEKETVEVANTLSQYLLMLDDEMAENEYEILDSVQEEEDLWNFQVKVTITDDEGKETIQERTYIGQDGTLTWKKD